MTINILMGCKHVNYITTLYNYVTVINFKVFIFTLLFLELNSTCDC
jgi:hypothetical protein